MKGLAGAAVWSLAVILAGASPATVAGPPASVQVMHLFDGAEGGANPRARLVSGGDGSLYGTTFGGGRGQGTVFRLSPSGAVETVHQFSGNDGAQPSGRLLAEGLRGRWRADGGMFVGATERGGEHDAGTIFAISRRGVIKVLHAFNGQDGRAPTGVIQGSDGAFYGTTQSGGEHDRGTVFRMDKDGAVTTLHAFDGTDGASPRAGLVRDGAGIFYGTTQFGGPYNGGTVFRIDEEGTLSVLHAFTFGADGAFPLAALVQGTDGELYGTTYQGARGHGTVFRITRAGALTTLHAFFPGDGEGGQPFGSLVPDSDQSLYGTTESGGTGGHGTVFRITTAGELTTLHSFSGEDGSHPQSGLAWGKGHTLYGTTAGGGVTDNGVIFKLRPPNLRAPR